MFGISGQRYPILGVGESSKGFSMAQLRRLSGLPALPIWRMLGGPFFPPHFHTIFALCRRYLVALELALDAELDFEQIPCVHPGHRTGILWPTWGVQKPRKSNWWFFFGLQHLDHRHVASPIFTHRSDEINQQNDDAIWCNQEQVDMLGGYPFWTENVGALVTKMLRLGLHTRLTPLASTNHRQVLGVETGTYCKYESGCVWKWSTVYPPVAVLMGNMMSPFICPLNHCIPFFNIPLNISPSR